MNRRLFIATLLSVALLSGNEVKIVLEGSGYFPVMIRLQTGCWRWYGAAERTWM